MIWNFHTLFYKILKLEYSKNYKRPLILLPTDNFTGLLLCVRPKNRLSGNTRGAGRVLGPAPLESIPLLHLEAASRTNVGGGGRGIG